MICTMTHLLYFVTTTLGHSVQIDPNYLCSWHTTQIVQCGTDYGSENDILVLGTQQVRCWFLLFVKLF
jgi:hypothetical protein